MFIYLVMAPHKYMTKLNWKSLNKKPMYDFHIFMRPHAHEMYLYFMKVFAF